MSLLLLLNTVAAKAQNVSAGISGTVTDADGPVQAANIQVTGVHTGVSYGTISNQSGLWTVSGLKSGEYDVSVSFIGYETAIVSGIVLSAGQDYRLDIVLQESSNMLSDVNVTETATRFTETRTGQTYSVRNERIAMLPSSSRSLLDFSRLSPYSGNDNSMAGRDGRTTALIIDGAVLNNSFGLSSDLPGAGTPVSIDAVEEAQVIIAPYDVRQSNFTGGGINVVTKSGTNTLTGSAYNYVHNENLRGNSIDGTSLGARDTERRSIYGITLGGPIIKNRLFYFINSECEYAPQPISEWTLSADGVGHADQLVSRVTQSDMDRFSNALARYGYDAGSTDLTDGNETNLKFLAKIDWHITDNHNLMLRYNYTGNTQWCTPNDRSTVGSKAVHNRISEYGYAFRNNCYKINDNAWSVVAELNSHLGQGMSNHLLLTVSDVSNSRSTDSSWFPHIDIMSESDAFMSAGCELFTYGTGNYVRTYSAADQLRWTFGRSIMTAGLEYQYQKGATNYRMYGTGYYRYASIEDFENGAAPVAFGMTYGYDNVSDPAAMTSFGQTSAYIQSETQLSDRLTITYGLRADLMQYLENIETNLSYKALDWTAHYYTADNVPEGFSSPVFDTGSWPDANIQWSPRVGFNWNATGDRSVVLRGGSGIFKGRIPLVFLACIPSYSNLLQNTVAITSDSNGFLSGLAGNFLYTEEDLKSYLHSYGYPSESNPNQAVKSATVCGVASDFRLPSIWRSSLAADLRLPASFPLSLTLEGIYDKDINAVCAENLCVLADDNFTHFSGADQRIDYGSSDSPLFNSSVTGGAVMMRNTSKGYGWSAAATLTAIPVQDLRLELSYIHSVAKSVSDMTGSSLYSTWSNNVGVNLSDYNTLHSSAYVLPDKLTFSASYRIKHGTRYSTDLGLVYSGHQAGNYSYTYTRNLAGRNYSFLLYIPASKTDVQFADTEQFTAEQQQDALWQFVENDKYLSKHRGEYAEMNAAHMPWIHRIDLHLAENVKLSEGTLQLSADVMNLANLFNDSWGVTQTPTACNGGCIMTFDHTDASGCPVYTLYSNGDGLLKDSFAPLKSSANCWYLQLGIKYIFNN